jgi:alkane 1-monooxygenase
MSRTDPYVEAKMSAVPVQTRVLPSTRWAFHASAFVFPLIVSTFLATGPYQGLGASAWLLWVVAFVVMDALARPERGEPAEAPDALFDLQLYGLAALQIANLAGFVVSVAHHGVFTLHALVGVILVGLNSGYSGIVVAHELCHRPERHARFLARVLMAGVFYEHFTTEHVRGHHAKVGTYEDGATARHGESYWAFLVRTVPQQFWSAWAIDRRTIAQGLVGSVALAVTIGVLAGPGALLAFTGQAVLAVMMLEAVNWFEHWGLVRAEKRPTTVDSWDAESRMTLYSLVGLSRHADHHAHAARPYHKLRHFDESPKLPLGYLSLAIVTLFAEGWVRGKLDVELRRKALGPYRPAIG